MRSEFCICMYVHISIRYITYSTYLNTEYKLCTLYQVNVTLSLIQN